MEHEKEKSLEKRPHPVSTDPAEKTSPEKKVSKASAEAVATDAPVRRTLDLELAEEEFPATQADTPQPHGRVELKPVEEVPKSKGVEAGRETEDQKTLRDALARIQQLEDALKTEKAVREKEALAKKTEVVIQAPVGQATPQNRPRIEDTPMTGASTSADESALSAGGQEPASDADMDPAEDVGDMMTFPNGLKMLSHDALRMRLKRLCEVKAKSKKCHVDLKTREQYDSGGEGREWLEIGLVEALEKVGPGGLRNHKQVKAPLAHT